jgi:hypothetical protein
MRLVGWQTIVSSWNALIHGRRGSEAMAGILENILIMVLTVVCLLGGGYLALVLLGWVMKLKSGHREQEGLTDLWISLKHQQNAQNEPTDQQPDAND